MNRQIPRSLAAAILVVATVSVLWIVGKLTPNASLTQSPMIGKTAPALTLPAEGGKKLALSSYEGKLVLVNLWATWCGPCREELPDLVALQKQYAEKGFTVVGLSRDTNLETALAFAKQQQLNYPIALGTDEAASAFGNVNAIPATFLIDRNGKIVEAFRGLAPKEALETVIQRYL